MKGVYQTHFETIHQGQRISPTCIICGRVFNNENDRKNHQHSCPNILKPNLRLNTSVSIVRGALTPLKDSISTERCIIGDDELLLIASD